MNRIIIFIVLGLIGMNGFSFAQKMSIETDTSGTFVFDLSEIDSITFDVRTIEDSTITDIDGNVYHIKTIGTQVWMVENLKVNHYRNGDLIANVADSTQWTTLSTGAWCDYNNNPGNGNNYGHLYNWHAVADNRNIAPDGWHVPSSAEWQTLIDYLGGNAVAGGNMKTTGTIEGGDGLWYGPNTGFANESGFSGLPAGCRTINYGDFVCLGQQAYFWASNLASVNCPCFCGLFNTISSASLWDSANNTAGFSVRCIKD